MSLLDALHRRPPGLAGMPGPPPRFPVGNGLDFALQPPWEVVQRLVDGHGPITLAWLGPLPLVLLCDPAAIERVLIQGDEDGDVYKREPEPALRPMAPVGTSAFVENGPTHARLRAMGCPAQAGFDAFLDEAAAATVELARARARSGALVDGGGAFEQRVSRFLFDALCRTIVGEELGDGAYDDMCTTLEVSDLRMRTNLPIVTPGFLPARARWWDRFQTRVEAARGGGCPVTGAADAGASLLGRFLRGTRLSHDKFAIALAALFPGGFVSSGAVILNALVSLARDEAALTAVRAAVVDDHARGGVVDDARLEALVPLEQVVRETMRRFTPVPIYLRRVGRAPLQLDRWTLAPDTLVAIAPGPVHMDPARWPDPQRFDPARWTPEVIASTPYGSDSFFPFGRGSRACEWSRFARTIIRAVLYGWLLESRPVIDGDGPAAQRFFHAVMTPTKVRGRLAPVAG